jgi:hypothetical protein
MSKATQDARRIKHMEAVLSGRVQITTYEEPKKKKSQANRKGGAAPTEEAEDKMMESYARCLRVLLPGIMAKLSQINDPRDSSKIKHSLPLLLLFGILIFLSHCGSRRAANRTIAHNSLLSLVETFVPGVKEMPHADTLARLLRDIDTDEIDVYYEEMIKNFLSSKQFKDIHSGRFLVAIDGTQKFSRKYKWDERTLSQNADDEDKQRHYVVALESVLILDNGMTLPIMTEILENRESAQCALKSQAELEGQPMTESIGFSEKPEGSKQDCETNAFKRLSKRLAKLLGKGCVTLVLDGLYATGPVISICNNYGWDYMISLKRDSLKTVWDDFYGLRKIESDKTLLTQWGKRQQEYFWSNNIEYTYGKNHKRLSLNLVTCSEIWTEEHPRSGGKPKEMKSEYAWLSSKCLSKDNVFKLCTTIARSRWRIENSFRVAKHNGYNYSHCYSYDWNTMKGFHFLMKFAVFLNVLTAFSEDLSFFVKLEGQMGFVRTVWKCISNAKWPLPAVIEPSSVNISVVLKNHKFNYPPLIKAA